MMQGYGGSISGAISDIKMILKYILQTIVLHQKFCISMCHFQCINIDDKRNQNCIVRDFSSKFKYTWHILLMYTVLSLV